MRVSTFRRVHNARAPTHRYTADYTPLQSLPMELSILLGNEPIHQSPWEIRVAPGPGPNAACSKAVLSAAEVTAGTSLAIELHVRNAGRQPVDLATTSPNSAVRVTMALRSILARPGSAGSIESARRQARDAGSWPMLLWPV